MPRPRRTILAAFAALGILASPVASAAEGEATGVDADALDIVMRAGRHLTGARSIRVEMRSLYEVVQESGQKLQFTSRDEAVIRRPDRATASFHRDDGQQRRLYYDGSNLTLFDVRENVYGQFPVPDTLDATLDYLELEVGAPVPLADIFYSDLSHLAEAAIEGTWVGPSRVGEHDCHQLAFRGEAVDWQLWIERGETPWIRKLVITYRDVPGVPQFGAIFERWDLSPDAPDSLFSFSPPDGAERIPTLARPAGARIRGPR